MILAPQERRHLDCDRCAELLDPLLRRLARQEALCRHVLGRLAHPFLRRRAHQRLGFVRLDDYARESLGVSGRELQELARVARHLRDLPLLRAAFADGALSWSQARLLVTIATPDTQAAWLARARDETVRDLHRAVEGEAADPNEDAVEGEPAVRCRVPCPRRVRRLWRYATELASRMSGARLPAWRAAEAIAAEGLASDAADAVASSDPAGARTTAPPAPLPPSAWVAVAEALPEDVEHLALDADFIDPYQLDARLRAAMRALQRIDFQTGRLLRLVADLRLHRAFGFHTLPDYVRERLGCSPRKVRALLALDRRLAALPVLAAAYRDGRVSFARALALLPVIQPENEAAWVARAQEVTIRRLGDLVEWAAEMEADEPPAAEAVLVFPSLEEMQMCAPACDAEVLFRGPGSVVALFRTAVRAFTPRGAPVWQGLERLLRHAVAEWTSRPRHRDPIFERDGWRCAVPACTARSSLHDHHVLYRSRGGDHARANRVAICAAHHLNGIHRFRIRVSGLAPHDLTWEIGCRPSRPPFLRTHGDRYLGLPLNPFNTPSSTLGPA